MKNLPDLCSGKLTLGCTELPVAMGMYHLDYPVIDSMMALAQAAVKWCME